MSQQFQRLPSVPAPTVIPERMRRAMMLLRLTRSGDCDLGLGLDFSLLSLLRGFSRRGAGDVARDPISPCRPRMSAPGRIPDRDYRPTVQ